MAKLKDKDYEIMVSVASRIEIMGEGFVIKPPYISNMKGSSSDADDIAKYFKAEYKKHSPINPDFSDRLKNAIKIFLKTIPSIRVSHKVEAALKRGFKLFKESQPTEISKTYPKEKSITIDRSLPKLVWKGTPAHFAYIIDLLINKGYIEKPTRSAEANAALFLRMFAFAEHNPSKQSLGGILHKESDPIKNPDHKIRFQRIPQRTELDN